MRAEIIAVGTEMLLGDIVNTNAQFLSKELAQVGIDVYRQAVVGDNENRLLEILVEALKRSDIVITTGGLGPTKDDLTKETVCKLFNMELELHKESEKALIKRFSKSGRKISENNYKQVYFPKEAIVLPNPNGTAPGAILEKNNKIIIVLPGPPKEMKPMFINSVKEFLKEKGDGVIVSKVVRALRIGESAAAEKLEDLIDNSINPTIAPYAKEEDVIFRITAKAESEEEALRLIEPVKEKVKERLRIDYYAEEEETIQEVVGKLILEKGLKIATVESCTGGEIASRLISLSGISEAFLEGAITYSNKSKVKTLEVKEETLEKYGPVSEEVVKEMVIGIAKKAGVDIAIATTGIAGPHGGTDEKPVGLVYIAIYFKGEVKIYKNLFAGNRDEIRKRASISALDYVRRSLIEE